MNMRPLSYPLLVIIGIFWFGGMVWGAPGDLVWETPVEFGYPVITEQIILSGDKVIVTGHYDIPETPVSLSRIIAFIMAYDSETGNLRWQHVMDAEGIRMSGISYIVSAGNKILVTCAEYPYGVNVESKTFLRCYELKSGQIFWEASGVPTDRPHCWSEGMVTSITKVFIWAKDATNTALLQAYELGGRWWFHRVGQPGSE